MEYLLSYQAWLAAGLIFTLRVMDMSLDTLRVLFVMRGRKSIHHKNIADAVSV